MTDSTRRRRVLLLGATAAAVVAIELAGGGTAWATWTAPAQSVRAAATTGSVSVGIRGVEDLATTYSSDALTRTALVTVSNAGSVPATTTLSLAATAGSALSSAVRIDIWQSTNANPCSGAPSSAAITGSGATIAPVVATLAAGVSRSTCVRTSVSQGQRFDLSGGATTLDATVTARQGSWTGTAHARAAQVIADTVTPSVPSKTAETDSSITLTWAAPADTSGIGSYAVYRDGVLVRVVPASVRSFTDTGLLVSKYYAYTVRSVATGTGGNASPMSPGIQHATGWLTATSRYVLRNDATGTCIASGGRPPARRSSRRPARRARPRPGSSRPRSPGSGSPRRRTRRCTGTPRATGPPCSVPSTTSVPRSGRPKRSARAAGSSGSATGTTCA
ncbi:fibronectin type III domain-containing protein [Curtobacterium flaccumfaciens]|nr:fibronectin type III domain-containing protein [Curtobacterium flaccumfaciens]